MQLAMLDRIDELRLRVPRLVDAYDDGDPAFSDDVKRWMHEIEETLTAGRVAAAAGIATLRGTLVAAEGGTIPAGMTFAGRTTPRKIRDSTAADMLRRADELVAGATGSAVAQLAEATRLIRQMLPVAIRKQLIGGSIAASWAAMENDADLAAVAAHVAGLAGRADAMVLFGRELGAADAGNRAVEGS